MVLSQDLGAEPGVGSWEEWHCIISKPLSPEMGSELGTGIGRAQLGDWMGGSNLVSKSFHMNPQSTF